MDKKEFAHWEFKAGEETLSRNLRARLAWDLGDFHS